MTVQVTCPEYGHVVVIRWLWWFLEWEHEGEWETDPYPWMQNVTVIGVEGVAQIRGILTPADSGIAD